MKKNFFARVWAAIKDRAFAAQVVTESMGSAFKYFIIFVLIVGAIGMLKVGYEVNAGLQEASTALTNEIPDFSFSNGEFYFAGEMPYQVASDDGSIFVIDTTGKTDSSILADYKEGMLITATELIQKNNSIKYQSINFKDLAMFDLSRQKIVNYLDNWSAIIAILVFLIGLIAFVIGKMINIMMVSLIALIVNLFFKKRQLYEDLVKLSIYAITSSTIIKMILNLVGLTVPYFFVIYYGIVIFYLSWYLKEINTNVKLQGAQPEAEQIQSNGEDNSI